MTNSVTINYDTWIPMPEVMSRTGMSQRTIYRMVEKGDLRQAARPIPGRRPLPVFDPEGVASLEASILKARPQVLPPDSGDLAVALRLAQTASKMANGTKALAKPGDTMAERNPIRWPISELAHKVYLETQEAVLYSGLTEEYLAGLARSGAIKRIDSMRPYRYRRADLDKL